MSYDLNTFVSDCRAILARDGGPKRHEQVRLKLERLLANRDFVETYCGEDVPRGLKVLYEDPDLGFQILAHINDKARVSPPHDHGASWAIYGQATHYTDMIEWEREDDGSDRKSTRLNSSHVKISYAVFCLKKNKKKKLIITYSHKKKKKTLQKRIINILLFFNVIYFLSVYFIKNLDYFYFFFFFFF